MQESELIELNIVIATLHYGTWPEGRCLVPVAVRENLLLKAPRSGH